MQLSSLSTSWYFNGYVSLPSGTSISSLLKLPTGITQTLRITNLTPLHNGTYEALLLINTGSSSYFQQFGCPNDYRNFVYSSSRAGVYLIILDQISFNLQYYGKLKLWIPKLLYVTCLLSLICNRTSCGPHSVKQISSSGQWKHYSQLHCWWWLPSSQ